MTNLRNLRFADGTVIQTTGNITEFLFRHHTERVADWLEHKEKFDHQMRLIDAFLKRNKEGHNG